MRALAAICGREYASMFRIPLGWVVVALFVLLSSPLFCWYVVIPGGAATMREMFGIWWKLLLILCPAISMRLFSEELRSGKITLWDHTFEIPGNSLFAEVVLAETISVGKATHKTKLAGNDKLEIYEYPGGYAGRFDGIDAGGGEKAADVQKIFQDNKRTAAIRGQQEAVAGLVIVATSNCRQMVSGHKFTLEKHINANGPYVVTAARHICRASDFRSGGEEEFHYSNSITCIPLAVPFRPARTTHRPTVAGSQTATVVGPGGEEIFTDKYGRVKVQFHWDRQGKKNADSSCWARVSTLWAGKQWGMIHIPRIGQEVIVDFLEGDPDQPIVTGSVYNAEMMPPWALPANKTQSGIITRSSLGGGPANFNSIRFEDKKGSEQLFIHAEKNQDIEVENDETHWVGHDRAMVIDHDKSEHVKNNKAITVDKNHTEQIGKAMTINVGSTLTETVAINYMETVGGAMELTIGAALAITVGGAMAETVGMAKVETIAGLKSETIGGNLSVMVGKNLSETVKDNQVVTIGKDLTEKVGGKHKEDIAKEYIVNAKKMQFVAEEEINIKTGSAEIIMKKNGDITIKGNKINIKGDGDIIIKGSKIMEN